MHAFSGDGVEQALLLWLFTDTLSHIQAVANAARTRLLHYTAKLQCTAANPDPTPAEAAQLDALKIAISTNAAAIQALASMASSAMLTVDDEPAALDSASILGNIAGCGRGVAAALADTPQCLQSLSGAVRSPKKAVGAAAAAALGNIAQWSCQLALLVASTDGCMSGMVQLLNGGIESNAIADQLAGGAAAVAITMITAHPLAKVQFLACCEGAADALRRAEQLVKEAETARARAREAMRTNALARTERQMDRASEAARARLVARDAGAGGNWPFSGLFQTQEMLGMHMGHVDMKWVAAAVGLVAYFAASACIRMAQRVSNP